MLGQIYAWLMFLAIQGSAHFMKDLFSDARDTDDPSIDIDIEQLKTGRDADHRFNYLANQDMKLLFSNQTCIPQTFGYSLEKAAKIFPEYVYPPCSDKYIGKDIPKIELDLANNKFTLHCPSNSTEQYLTGPGKLMTFPKKEEIYPQLKIKDLNGRVGEIGPDDEYILASCFGKFDVIEQWVRPNVQEYQRVVKARGTEGKPILLFMLVVDSFSRRHFFQKLNETIDYLSSMGDDYVVEDFKLHNVIGDGSAHNTLPIFTKWYDTHDIEGHSFADNLGEDAIWADMKKQNFMNLLMTETCDTQFPAGIGRFPKVDHISRQLACALSTISNFHTAKTDVMTQRCVGPHMSHYYPLDYIKKFTKTYPLANQWIYTHLTPAHEATGQHAQTLDHDLVVFLKEFLEMTKETHEVVIFLHGDHGMRFGEWRRDLAAVQEHKLPAFFLIGSKSLISSIPGAQETIRENTWKLFSKKDIRRTLLWLSHHPHYKTLPYEDSLRHVSLFSELLPLNRTCVDAGIPVWYCSCLELKSLSLNEHYRPLAEYLVAYAIELMNREVYSKYDRRLTVCEKITGGKVLSLAGMHATQTDQLFRVDFTVANKHDSQFSVTMLLSPHPYDGAVKSWQEKYYLGGIDPFAFENNRNFVKVIAMSRMDKFEGPCEDISRKAGVKPDYCFCKDDAVDL